MRFPLPDRLKWHEPTLDGSVRCFLISYTLWGLFWIQFLITLFCGFPGVRFTSSFSLFLHLEIPGYPFTLAQLLLGISLGTASLFFVLAWASTTGSRARWRQRFLVLLFSVIPIAWASLQFQIRDFRLNSAKSELKYWTERETPGIHGESRIQLLKEVLRPFEEGQPSAEKD